MADESAFPVFDQIDRSEMSAAVGSLIRERREKFQIAIRDFCDVVGINKETLRRIESGQSLPRLDHLRSIALVLQLSPFDLLWIDRAEFKDAKKSISKDVRSVAKAKFDASAHFIGSRSAS